MEGAWICSAVPTFWALVATVFLLWPGLGANWFGAGGSPNHSLANLSFPHQRLQYELSRIVPLTIIIVIGLVFYLLGGKTRPSCRDLPGRHHQSRTATTCSRSSRIGGTIRRRT